MADHEKFAGEEDLEPIETGEGDTEGPKRAKAPRLITLTLPRGQPARLVEMEENVIAAVRQLFADISSLDMSIEEIGKGVSQLMATRIKKVGVDWQKHRRRPGRHPVVYRTGGRGRARGGVPIAANRASGGVSGASVRRFWVEPIDPPVRLVMNAQKHEFTADGQVDQRSAALRAAQQDALALLQNMLDSRESALKPIGRLMQSLSSWKAFNRPSNTELPPVGCKHTAEFMARTELLRQKEVALSLAKVRAAERLSEVNEVDDERRKDGAPRGPSGK